MLYSYGLPSMNAYEMRGCTLSPSSRSVLAFKSPSGHWLQENIFLYISKATHAQPLAHSMSQCHLSHNCHKNYKSLKHFHSFATQVGEKRNKYISIMSWSFKSLLKLWNSRLQDQGLRSQGGADKITLWTCLKSKKNLSL